MKTKFSLIMLLCLLLLVGCNSQKASGQLALNSAVKTTLTMKEHVPEDFFPHEITIVSAGDSLTQGVGDTTNSGGYIPYLKAQLEGEKSVKEVYFTNFGVKGNRSDQLLKRIGTEKIKEAIEKADIVIVTIGGNDIMKVVREHLTNLNLKAFKREQQNYLTNLEKTIDAIREENPNSQIVLVGLYNPFMTWFANIEEINQIIDDWNEASKKLLSHYPDTYFVKVDDLFLEQGEKLLYTDYFHPNDEGYKRMADRIYHSITEEALEKLMTAKNQQ